MWPYDMMLGVFIIPSGRTRPSLSRDSVNMIVFFFFFFYDRLLVILLVLQRLPDLIRLQVHSFTTLSPMGTSPLTFSFLHFPTSVENVYEHIWIKLFVLNFIYLKSGIWWSVSTDFIKLHYYIHLPETFQSTFVIHIL